MSVDKPSMNRKMQISRFPGGLAVTRVTLDDGTWDRHYRSFAEACQEAFAIGLMSNADAVKAANADFDSLEQPCLPVSPVSLLDAGFERASAQEKHRIIGLSEERRRLSGYTI